MSVKKIGLIVGREWSFPPAFIEEVNSRDAGVMPSTPSWAARDERAVRIRRADRPHQP
jgi:hypothetical protein